MITITKLESLKLAVGRYDLCIIERLADDGCVRTYLMAKAGSGTRGGHIRNARLVLLTTTDDCRAHELGLLRRQK